MEKNYRVHTNISSDTFLNVNMKQDFDFLEILSLKLGKRDTYRFHSSNYGVIAGRVLANDAFGIPNAKISVFIESDGLDSNDMKDIYPYSTTMSTDRNAIRYNLLPDYSDDTCYRVVGTFPRKRYMLDDNVQLEVYDKYWKYTTVTNQSGDYMLFAVPTGTQQIHVDIDLSDIGILSQKPSDFIFKGHTVEEFDSPSQFKSSTNLESLQQIISQNKSTVVYPFWGDPENGIAAITRCDIQISYKFEPTCVFMGSIVSDNDGNSIGHKCSPDEDSGLNSQLIAGEGTIEMIRKTQSGLVEEFPIKGNALIDSDGVWCYQIPMNLDYVGTDEYGNIVPTDNPKKGIPTRAQVRFRMSKRETGDEGFSRHTAKYLVPMNPEFNENSITPLSQAKTGQEIEKMYNFGSNTPQNCFRDLYWNNVYSVKNYIPKVQVAHRAYAPYFGGLKGSNLVDDQNPVPFNKLRVDLPFIYMVVCIIYSMIIIIVQFINFIICILDIVLYIINLIKNVSIFGFKPFKYLFGFIPDILACIPLSAGLSEDNTAYYPGCWYDDALDEAGCPEDMDERCTKNRSPGDLRDKIQQNLANDFKIIKLDFYQDWLNGCLYMPLWYWRKRKKKSFLFGLFTSSAKNEFCDCDKDEYSRLKTYVTCNMVYQNTSLQFENNEGDEEEDRWHRKRRNWVRYSNGLIKGVKNREGLTAYYYAAYQADDEDPSGVPMAQRTKPFKMVKLYSTDIILLGNLNENNIYGIPQFFKALPSTTCNTPPIATIEESLAKDNLNDDGSDNDAAGDNRDSGTVVTTGMDWGRKGGYDTPSFRKGLFMDLMCTAAGTYAKSCVNVERLSELGVNPDMTYSMSYSNGSQDVKTGIIDADGFVTKYELDDLDNRATFATLNHIGFVPQGYQETLGETATTTQVQDERTGYLIPKFKYIYPVDFDGRMGRIMERYKKDFEQASYDEPDESYITFRLGAEKDIDPDKNLEKRVRHFYHKNGSKFEMPIYNNSYYFYFGINKGNTAIDKFNKLFYSPCFQKNTNPFTIEIESMGKSYCPSVYDSVDQQYYKGHPYIRVSSDDISVPFKYILYDSSANIVIEESGMTETDFVIGGKINEGGKVVANVNGIVKYQHGKGEAEPEAVDNKYGTDGLSNQMYTLEVIDSNGRRMRERIELKIQKISVDFETKGLGTKFYSTASTRMDYICSDVTDFYGTIKINSYKVDGYLYTITAATPMAYDSITDSYKISISGTSSEYEEDEEGNKRQIAGTEKKSYAVLRISAMNSPNVGWVRDCMCDSGNTVYSVNGQGSNIAAAYQHSKWWFGNTGVDGSIIPTLFVYQPNRFVISISQLCKEGETFKELEDNSTSDIATVPNGNNFNAFLNDMPVKFMIGSVTDSNAATVANTSKFYRSEAVTDLKDDGISGWYGLHQEDSYMWDMSENQVLNRNKDMWSDFVKMYGDISDHDMKADILKYKFSTMFSLSRAGYIIGDGNRFSYNAVGGISPLLYRSVAPQYDNVQRLMAGMYVLSDGNATYCPYYLPNIVGNNFFGYGETSGPQFNRSYGENELNKLGNYFAAFTSNGGYTSKTEVDDSINVISIPNFAKLTPWDEQGEKRLGKDEYGLINRFRKAYRAEGIYQPYLRAMYVDRRMGYDIVLFSPCSSSIKLYPSTKQAKEKIWKSSRISGITYNGVEMSYDSDYNIISADTTEDETYATPNIRLEYSYNYSDDDEDAKTYYNSEADMIWEKDAYGTQKVDDNGKLVYDNDGKPVYEEGKEPKSGQILKRYYSASFAGNDIRNFFWSDFNKKRLLEYVSGGENNIENYNYVYKYPSLLGGFNGDFNRRNVIKNDCYPTKRLIDIGNLQARNTYDLIVESCSYKIKPYLEGNKIMCEAQNEPSIELYATPSNPVTFTPPNAESDDFSNAIYKITGTETRENVQYAILKVRSLDLNFKFTLMSDDNYDIYTSAPRVIKVLPFPITGKDYDGISLIKTVTDNGEICFNGSLDDILENDYVLLHRFSELTNDPIMLFFGIKDILVPEGIDGRYNGFVLPDGSTAHGMYFFRNSNDKYITSDDPDMQSIMFSSEIEVRNLSVFTILVERYYISKDESSIKKNLRVIEFGDLYDTRKVLIRVNEGNDKTYIEKVIASSSSQAGQADQSYAHIQTITFDIPVSSTGDPVNGICESFIDYRSMSYKVRFRSGDEAYDLKPSRVYTDESSGEGPGENPIVHVEVRWTQDMGVIADEDKWGNNTVCDIIAKTRSNFTYKLGDIRLKFKGQAGGYHSDSKTSDLQPGEKGGTSVQINY